VDKSIFFIIFSRTLYKSTFFLLTYYLCYLWQHHAGSEQGLWRIEYLNTGRAETEVCKQIGGRPCFYALLRMKRIACL